jgi:competence protein ComEC
MKTVVLSPGDSSLHHPCVATRTQYAVTVGLVPLTMFLFGQFSLISPLANAVAIPLISFVVTPLALLAAFCLQVRLLWCCRWRMRLCKCWQPF